MAEKTFEELVAGAVQSVQVKAAAGKQAAYQAAAFDCAVQNGELKRKVSKHFMAQDIKEQLAKRVALHTEVQSQLAQNPSLLMALDPSEAKRQARAIEKAQSDAAKAVVQVAPCSDAPALQPAPKPTSKKGKKGKSAGISA
jgi:hypothetical protein